MFARATTVVLLFGIAAGIWPPAALAAASSEAASVLILVNDAVLPAAGTGSKGASVWLGEYYAKQRGIPTANIVHLNVPLSCCQNNPAAWDSWNIDWTKFDTTIRQPLKKFLSSKGLTDKINYIVTTYGIPLRVKHASGNPDNLSIDSFLASINSGQDAILLPNPYRSPATEGSLHFRNWTNPKGWKMYLVTRLDGPDVQIAAGLIDKAIHAEANLKATDGIGYFDWRHIGSAKDPYYAADQTMINAYNFAKERGFKSVLNDNGSSVAKMIHDAPNALWAWGWYSSASTWDGYQFVEGAVGAQFTSYSANSVQTMLPGAWVPVWLKAGITATWGATGEPYTAGYAPGDNLLNHFWTGYNFAESAYLAAPYLNHMMVFVGDPLYAPKIFQPAKAAFADPGVVNADGTSTISPGAIALLVGSDLSLCALTNSAASLPTTLCGTQVTFNGTPAPLYYTSAGQIAALVPRSLPPGQDVEVVVTREDGDTASGVVPASRFAAASPGIFLYVLDGTIRAVMQNSDYSTNGPLSPDLRLRPLKLGESGVIYANGLGPTDAAVGDGDPAPKNLARTLNAVELFVNGVAQHPFFAGFSPGLVGVYQVNFILDPATPILDNDQNAVWLNENGIDSPKARISLIAQ